MEYLPEDTYTVQEPEALAEWGNKLSTEQEQGIYEALEDVKANGGKSHDEAMKAMRKKYE